MFACLSDLLLRAARNLQLESEVRELQGLLRTLRTDMGDQVERLEQVTEGQWGGRGAGDQWELRRQ